MCTDLPVVRAVTDALGKHFDVSLTRDLRSLTDRARETPAPLAALVDHAGSDHSAIDALQSIQSAFPTIKRILLADYCSLGMIVQGLHTGAVERIVYKPIYVPELLGAIGPENLPASLTSAPSSGAAPHPRQNPSRSVG